jgi:hypothetical protein
VELLEFELVEDCHGFLFLVEFVEVGLDDRKLNDVLLFWWVGQGGLEELCLAIALFDVLVKDLKEGYKSNFGHLQR